MANKIVNDSKLQDIDVFIASYWYNYSNQVGVSTEASRITRDFIFGRFTVLFGARRVHPPTAHTPIPPKPKFNFNINLLIIDIILYFIKF